MATFFLGGICLESAISAQHNLSHYLVSCLSSFPSLRCGIAVINGKVYAVGGFNGSLRVRTVDVYDPARDSWSSCASMEARRSTLGVATLNNCIYAVSCGCNHSLIGFTVLKISVLCSVAVLAEDKFSLQTLI